MLSGVTFSYRDGSGSRKIFEDASYEFSPGFHAVMGPSGSGKTTLFRLLTKEITPTLGTISLHGNDISTLMDLQIRRDYIGQVFQDYLLIPYLTARENILFAREISGKYTKKNIHDGIDDLLELVGIADLAEKNTSMLSGGEKQRVAICRALALETPIILADEPTGALDEENTLLIGKILQNISREKGMTILAATHDKNFAELADSIVRIHQHTLIKD